MEASLKITDIGSNGDGIARLESGEVVFVPFAATGDIVMAQVAKDNDGVNRAKINSILLKSPDRATPPCRHFGLCGGCALQHLSVSAYQSFKMDHVLSALEKAHITPPEEINSVFIPDHTRRRANFAARVVKGKAMIGFHERKSANIRDVPDCLLITEEVRNVMEKLKPYLPNIVGEGNKIDILIQCVEGQNEIGLTGKVAPGWEAQQALSDALRACDASRISLRARDFEAYETLLDAKPFYKRFGDLTINLASGAFLQPSAEGEAALVRLVTQEMGDARKVADLFCGNGTFTGSVMSGREVLAVDSAGDAIASLSAAGVNAVQRNLFKEPMSEAELSGMDAVILDPPRAGASTQSARLAYSDVRKVVYVSCNPQSFAKDAAMLIEGGYALRRLTLVDQFIWSTHTELVGLFERP